MTGASPPHNGTTSSLKPSNARVHLCTSHACSHIQYCIAHLIMHTCIEPIVLQQPHTCMMQHTALHQCYTEGQDTSFC